MRIHSCRSHISTALSWISYAWERIKREFLMFLCVRVFQFKIQKEIRGKWYVWNFLYSRDLSILKFITTIHRAKDPHFWMRKLTLRRDICWNSHCWVMGGNRRLIPLLQYSHHFRSARGFLIGVPRAQGQGNTLATTLWGKCGEKRLPDKMFGSLCSFQASSSAFNFLTVHT